MAEIPAFEEQRFAGVFRQSVGTAVADVQASRMVSLAKGPPGRPCKLHLINVDGDNFDSSAVYQQIEFASARLPFLGLDDNAGLQCIEGADQFFRIIGKRPRKGFGIAQGREPVERQMGVFRQPL